MAAELDFFPQGLISCEDAFQQSAMASPMQMQVQQMAQEPQGDLAAMAAAMATPQGKKGPGEPGLSGG